MRRLNRASTELSWPMFAVSEVIFWGLFLIVRDRFGLQGNTQTLLAGLGVSLVAWLVAWATCRWLLS